jgi:hypothetical protein
MDEAAKSRALVAPYTNVSKLPYTEPSAFGKKAEKLKC